MVIPPLVALVLADSCIAPVVNEHLGGKPYLNGCPLTVFTWAMPGITDQSM